MNVHHGQVTNEAEFDHTLYWQTDLSVAWLSVKTHLLSTFRSDQEQPASDNVDSARTQGIVDSDRPIGYYRLRRRMANDDIYLRQLTSAN